MNIIYFKLDKVRVIPEKVRVRAYTNISISFKIDTFLPFNSILTFIIRGGRNTKNDWYYLQPFDKNQPGFIELNIDPPSNVIPLLTTGKELVIKYIISERNGIKAGSCFKFNIYRTLVQSLAEKNKKFIILIRKPNNDLLVAENHPQINIINGSFNHIAIICPSIVEIGEHFNILLRAEDERYNIINDFSDRIKLVQLKNLESKKEIKSIKFTEKNEGILWDSDYSFQDSGVYQIEAIYNNHTFESNPIMCVKGNHRNKLYWGYIHGHTTKSDGLSEPETYFKNMINAGLNFGTTTEHDHKWETSDEDFEELKKICEHFNSEKFVTFFGYEWGYWYTGYGDICIYFLDPTLPVLRSDTNKYNSTPKLIKNLLPYKDKALMIAHHTALRPGYRNWDFFENSIERLVELYSTWGNQEFPSNEGNPLPPRYKFFGRGKFGPKKGPVIEKKGSFVRDALIRGYKLGFTSGGDDHFGLYPSGPYNPDNGIYPSGILAVWASDLTRESLWNALVNRKCYGTTGPRVIIEFNIENYFMGDIVDIELDPKTFKNRKFNLTITSPTLIEKIELIRNNEIYKSQIINSKMFRGEFGDSDAFQDVCQLHQNEREEFVFYYPRIYLSDNNMAWASPIWITKKK